MKLPRWAQRDDPLTPDSAALRAGAALMALDLALAPSGVCATWPTSSPGGSTPPAPEVTTRSPGRTSSALSRNSTKGATELSPCSSAFCPEGWMVTGTAEFESVSRSTRAMSWPTPEMRPTTPSPSITAQPSRIRSCAPILISTDWRKGDPESASTVPLT